MHYYARSIDDLGHILKRVRIEKDLTQAELAESLGVKQNAISRLESGSVGVVLKLLFRLLAKLDLEIEIRPRQKTSAQDIADMFT